MGNVIRPVIAGGSSESVPRGRYAILFNFRKADIGKSVDGSVGIGSTEVFTQTKTARSDFDNISNATLIPNGVVWPRQPSDRGSYTAAVVPSDGSTAIVSNVTVFEPGAKKIVELDGHSWHCSPLAVMAGSQIARVACEAGTANRYQLLGEISQGEIHAGKPSDHRQPEDKYHQGSVIVPVSGGFARFTVDHNTRLYFDWTSDLSSVAGAPALVSSGASDTYVSCVPHPTADTVYAVVRKGNTLVLHEIQGCSTGSPTVVEDVLCNGSASSWRPYPRQMHMVQDSAGDYLLAMPYQVRQDPAWRQVGVIFYEIATRQCRNLVGEDVGTTTLGTSVSPKLTRAQAADSIFGTSGSMLVLDPLSGGTRYACDYFAIRAEPTKKFSVGVVFADTPSATTDSFAASCDVRLAWHNGTTRYATSVVSNVFGLNGADSYRITGGCLFLADGTMEIALGVIEDGEQPIAIDPYNWFGALSRVQFWHVNLTGVASAANLQSAVTIQPGMTLQVDAVHTARIVPIYDRPGAYCVFEAKQEIDEIWGVMQSRIYDPNGVLV